MTISASDVAEYQRRLEEFDPDFIEEAREADLKRKRRVGLLNAQGRKDQAELMKLPAFRRFLFTVLARGGIYAAIRHAQEADYAYDAGRRALALELLNESLAIRPEFAIELSMEQAKLEESVKDVSPE